MVALPQDINRQVKEAAPYGFSIQTDTVVTYAAQINAGVDIPLLVATDTDFYIQDVWITALTVADNSTLTFTLETWSAGSLVASGELQSSVATSASPTAMLAAVPLDLLVNQNQVLTDGNLLMLAVTVAGGGDITNSQIQVRYRRKA
jgi:hypothetical protein